jgi:hypothetical protein
MFLFIILNIITKKSIDSRIKSATRNLLITKSMRTNHPENQYYHLKERLNRAKLNANRIRLRRKKLLFINLHVKCYCLNIVFFHF